MTTEVAEAATVAEAWAKHGQAEERREQHVSTLDEVERREEDLERRLAEAIEAGDVDQVEQLTDKREDVVLVRQRAANIAAASVKAVEGAKREVRRAQIRDRARKIEELAPEIQETIEGARSAARELDRRLDELVGHARLVKSSRRFAEHHLANDLQGEDLPRPDWPAGTHGIGDLVWDLARDIRPALKRLTE